MGSGGINHARERSAQRGQVVDQPELDLGSCFLAEAQDEGRQALAARKAGRQTETGLPQRELERIGALIRQAAPLGHDQSRQLWPSIERQGTDHPRVGAAPWSVT